MSKVSGYKELKKAIKVSSRLEWEIAINTNNQRGKVYTQTELLEMFPADNGDANGASKTCYVLDNIVIKRQKPTCNRDFGNQVAKEIECFIKANDELRSVLCPILAYYGVKSDKVTAEDDKAYEKYLVISQKAIYIGDFDDCCKKAFELNEEEGYYNKYIDHYTMYRRLGDILYNNNINDWDGHPYNSGVIFDYENNRYTAVIIDYAL